MLGLQGTDVVSDTIRCRVCLPAALDRFPRHRRSRFVIIGGMFASLMAAAAALRAGNTSAAELVDGCLAAVDAHSARTNAFVSIDEAGARSAAAEADRERQAGLDRGPLHGIPISLKDLIDVRGVVTTAASRVLDDRVAPADAAIVTRLRAAGAVIIGRTNLHEFALGTTCEDSAFGPVLHPADPTRSPGGSSGGSAVSVATGMSLASIGTDTGGSVRIPSAACGLVGLKPSLHDVPTTGVIPLSVTCDHVGPLARTVADAAAVFAALAGRSYGPPAPRDRRNLKLGRLRGYFDNPLDALVRRAYETTLERLQASGVHVSDRHLSGAERITETYVNIVLPEAAHWHAPYLDTRAGEYTPNVHSRILHGRTIPAVALLRAHATAAAFRDAVDAALEDCDALVLPTLPILAPQLGSTDVVIDPAEGSILPVRGAMLRLTQLFNLTGHPAVTLPVATAGLPVGLQLVGRLDRTDGLLAIAAACEPIVAATDGAR